jgi:PAS domain S-box-containing protein
MEVFVVDNDETIIVYLKKLLRKDGHTVKTASDGLTALQILKSYTPDVALIDLIMPKIDGRKLCQIMRTMPKLRDTRMVMLSAVSKEERIQFTEMGFDACIAKGPLKRQGENVRRVLKLIESDEAGAMPDGILGLENLFPRGITKELLSSKRHHELVEENLTEGILELAAGNSIIYANPAALHILGLPEEHVLGHPFSSLLPVHQRIAPLQLLTEAQKENRTATSAVDVGDRRVEISCFNIREDEGNTVILILNDITRRVAAARELQKAHDELESRVEERTVELARVNEEIKASLGEKEMLLREVHHRVKNNLQIVSSLLSLQANSVPDEKTAEIFKESIHRINSIGMVHETLYHSQGLAKVDLGSYVESVATQLVESYGTEDKRIYLSVKSEPVTLTIDQAVPGGLIVNELITNSLKHAFPGDSTGTIRVLVQAGGTDTCRLIVSDNGIGLPEGYNDGKTLGMNIVRTLVTQLDGEIAINSGDGVRVTIDFPIG